MRIDEDRIIREIEQVKPKTILLSCPDGYISGVRELAAKMEEKYKVQTMISLDPCYGSCDIMDTDASRLGVDIAFHIGHNSAVKRMGERTVMVDVYDDVDFTKVIQKSIPTLKKYRRLGLCTVSQHLHKLDSAKKALEAEGFEVYVGKGKERLLDGQILGCRFYPAFNIRDKIDALVFLGQSRFHPLGAALATGRPTFMLDPYLQTVEDVTEQAEKWWKRAVLQLYKAVDAESFGVIIGLREGQMMLQRALQIKKRLLEHGKEVQMITLREVTEDRLALFRNIDVFIQTACPRISVDGETFSRPILSIPQTEALFELWSGKEPNTFLEKPNWL
ncbi:MAG: diphthamide biosynthesis enzyme Dph2 [Nitrososphaerales archaeon]